MASDRRQYENAVAKWTKFQTNGDCSAPIEEGVVAVVASNYPYNQIRTIHDGDFDLIDAVNDDEIDIDNFNEEAKQIAQKLGMIGVTTELITDADMGNITDVIIDEQISDIIFIGHGALAGIFVTGAKDDFSLLSRKKLPQL